MAIKNWEIIVDRQTKPIPQAGFAKPLILSTEKDFEFKTFEELGDITSDFDEETDTYKLANRILGQSTRPAEFAILGVDFEEDSGDVGELIAALNDTEGDYFFLTCISQHEDVIEALVEWVESQHKMYGFSTDDPVLVEVLSEKEYDNSFCIIHHEPKTYPAEG